MTAIHSVSTAGKIRLFFWAASLMLSGANAVHAQGCTNAAATPSVCAFDAVKHAAAKTKIKGVLLYDWINRGSHDRSPTQKHMMRLAQKYGFRLDRSQSETYINATTLQGIDLIVFNNTDGDPLQSATALQAVKNFVEKDGKGVLVIHAGAAYIPCPSEDLASPQCRWIMRGLRTQFDIHNFDLTKATIFADSVLTGEIPPRATGSSAVAAKQNHGRKNPETRMIFETLPTNAGAGTLMNRPYIWEGLGDEWYNYRNNPRLEGQRVLDGVTFGAINILLSLDESSVASNAECNGGINACKNQGTFGDRPVSWTRKIGNGMLAYQNAGHSDVYTRTRTAGAATVNDSIIEKYNWRLMKYLARDFVGCTSPGDANYNPEASVAVLHAGFDPASPCAGTSTISAKAVNRSGITASARMIHVSLASEGVHRVSVKDLTGKTVFTRSSHGPGEVEVPGLRKGHYIVKVASSGGEQVEKVEVRYP